ncbi:restriction endonuclease subunit S [Bacillus altitudinis]|uniref:restriction endonuclease subunit S n=1 Tax=Bacillus altitudinis TaxID=293387 RepID=UPI000BF2BF3C|nr:restriction endonuclease subunit S [Bacillus altitudinis]PGD45335.1 restriction endonuclease subunit S [Bacillus altitudinis]
MSDKITRLPQIRFAGFTDGWEQHRLGDIVQITMGQSPDSINYTDNPDDHILVQGNADMKNGRVVPRVWTTQVTKQAEKNDLILSVRAPVGDVGKTDYNVVLGRGVASIKGNDFIFQSLGRMKQNGYWTKLSTGSTFESINSNDIRGAYIMIPNKEEQKKIGDFFSNLDNLIILHQRKLELLKDTKKSLLQKMFPKDGANVPEIRFAGFTDAWEQRVLSDVKDVRDGTHDSPKYHNEGHPLVTSKNLTEHGLDMSDVSLISDEDFNAINQRSKVNVGDIIFGMIGTIGNPVILKRNDFAIKNVALIKRDGEVENEFLIQLLKSPVFYRYIRKENVGGTQKFLGLSQIRNFKFLVPSKAEQEKIGKFFYELDHLITLHQRELSSFKNLKKSLLQQMFI